MCRTLLLIRGSRHLIIPSVGVLAPSSNPSAVPPEQEGNTAARETNEAQQARGPLIAEPVVHLLRKQDDGGTPEGSDTSLGGQGRSGLVLVAVDEVVVGGVVEENETETHGETAETGADPDEPGIGRPGEDEQADGDEPAAEHHGDETDFGGGVAVVLGDHL